MCLFCCASDSKVKRKDSDSDSEEPTRGADSSPALPSQPQRVALFPGMDPSALKVGGVCPLTHSDGGGRGFEFLFSHIHIYFLLLKIASGCRHS